VLKAFHGEAPTATLPLPQMLHGRVLPTPASVVSSHLARGRWQILVRWESTPTRESTWEDVEDFKQLYPPTAVRARKRALSGGRERCHGQSGLQEEGMPIGRRPVVPWRGPQV
jgi:hypothetical protein